MNSSSQQPCEEVSEAKAQLITEVFDKLPETDKFVIKGIVRLIRDISDEKNVVTTKMTVSNLALVFGPVFVNPKDVSNPVVLMKAAKQGTAVVETFCEYLSVLDYPVEEEERTKSKAIKPIRAISEWNRASLR